VCRRKRSHGRRVGYRDRRSEPDIRERRCGAASEQELRAFIEYAHAWIWEYERAETVAELADEADVVVQGIIESVERGQSYASAANSDPTFATSVVWVVVEDVLAGSSALVIDDHVYIEFPHHAFGDVDPQDEEGGGATEVPFDHAAFADTVPVGARGIFFLSDRTNEPIMDHIRDEGAGRPPGAPLTQASMQGFLLGAADDQLVSVSAPLDAMPRPWHDLGSLEDVQAALEGGR
jgi:hypothetical protein